MTRELFYQFFENDGLGHSNCLEDDCPKLNFSVGTWLHDLRYICLIWKAMNLVIFAKEKEETLFALRLFKMQIFMNVKDFVFLRKLVNMRHVLVVSAIWTPNGGAEIPPGVRFSCDEEQVLSDGTAISDFAWYCSTTTHAQPVGQLEPNGYGLYDMSGNVWEWAHDGYWMYPETATFNPLGAPSDEHSLRGGRWGNEPYALRAAKRISVAPGFWDGNFGFRLAIRAETFGQALPIQDVK